VFPLEHGYTGHGAYLETAPIEQLWEWLPFALDVEPFRSYPEINHTPVASEEVAEEFPDVLM